MEIQETLLLIRQEVIEAALKQREYWFDTIGKDMLPGIDMVENQINNLLKINDKRIADPETRSILKAVLSDLATKISKWEYTPAIDQFHQAIFIDAISNQIEDLETEITFEITSNCWTYDKMDNLDLTFWKMWHRVVYQSRFQFNKIRNKNRVKKQFPIVETSYIKKQFNNHDFLKYFVLLPMLTSISKGWRDYVRLHVNKVYNFQQKLDDVANAYLLLSKEIGEEEGIKALKSACQELIAQISILNNSENGKDEFIDGIYKTFDALEPKVLEKWQYAGTAVLPSGRFENSKFKNEIEKIEEKEKQDLKLWNNHLSSFVAEWRKNLELGQYQFGILEVLDKTSDSISKKLKSEVIPVFLNGGEIISQSLEIIEREKSADSSALFELITIESEKILGKLRQEALPGMLDIVLKADLEVAVRNYLDEVANIHDLLSNTHTIFTKRDDTGIVPRSHAENVPIKELAEIELLNDLREHFDSHLREVENRLKKIIRNISEIDQIVEFNLEAALNLINDRPSRKKIEEPQKTILEGLERTLLQINELIEELIFLENYIYDELSKISFNLIDQLEELFSSDKVLEYKFRLTRARAREELDARQKALWEKAKGAAPSLYNGIKKAISLLQTYRKRFSKLTGLSTETQRLEEDLRNYLIDAEKRVQQLPYVYQRLFRSEPWVDERFFEGRKVELNALLDDLTKWEKGYYTNTILVGEKGSGKTTFIEYARLKHFKGKKVYHYANLTNIPTEEILLEKLKQTFEIDNVDSFSELEKRIQRRKASICIFENINNLYLRKIGGFSVLDKFFQFITNTGNKVFWIQSCSLYGWKYLNYAKKISRYYSRIITLDSLNPDDIESILLKRHRVSGYSLNFVIPDTDEKSKQMKRINDPAKLQALLHKNYFDKLKTIASGNILVAMMYWLKSFVKEQDGTVYISSVNEFDFLSILQLPVEDLFVLGLLIQQGEINQENLAECFNKTDIESRHQLVNLMNLGILIENNNSFIVNPLLYRPIVRALKTRNILH